MAAAAPLFCLMGTSMTFRHGPRSRGAAAKTSPKTRRVLSAFILGVALTAAGLAALASGVAGARGPFSPVAAFEGSSANAGGYRAEHIEIVRYDGSETRRRHEYDDEDFAHRRRHGAHAGVRAAGQAVAGSLSQPVCVRLCDGYFFPLPTSASDYVSQGSACNSLCPDAPTEVYYRNGAEKIEDSVSVSGKPYSTLPVSLRYRTTTDETCSCHRNAVAYAPLKDPTLRRGDAIMTPAGFMVFRGVEGAPHGAGDFAALDRAGLATDARGALTALERASLTPVHPTLKDWLISQNAPAGLGPQAALRAPTQLAMRVPSSWRAPAAVSGGKIRLLTWRSRDE
jgi:hypothetical protein